MNGGLEVSHVTLVHGFNLFNFVMCWTVCTRGFLVGCFAMLFFAVSVVPK